MAVGLGEQGLGDVEEIEAEGGAVQVGEEAGGEAGIEAAVAWAEGDEVEGAVAAEVEDEGGGAVQGHDAVGL
jgi:hypothetical protein